MMPIDVNPTLDARPFRIMLLFLELLHKGCEMNTEVASLHSSIPLGVRRKIVALHRWSS